MKRDNISPAAAGFDVVTREKSFECTTAGPAAVMTMVGADIGMIVSTHRTFPPPLIRRLAGSSVIDAIRKGTVVPPLPTIPRAPRNAPVPPTIAQPPFPWAVGDPGEGGPPDSPKATIVPTSVPSLFKISKIFSRIEL